MSSETFRCKHGVVHSLTDVCNCGESSTSTDLLGCNKLRSELDMTDQCKHCTIRGDYNSCIDANCFGHESWIDIQRIERIKVLETALKEISALSACRQDEGCDLALSALDTVDSLST